MQQLGHLHKQTLSVSHKLVESMKVLQMTEQELARYISELSQSNPVIDIDLLSDFEYGRGDWRSAECIGYDTDNKSSDSDYTPFQEAETQIYGQSGLYEELVMQIIDAKLNAEDESICKYLASGVDDNGYMDITVGELSQELGIDLHKAEECIRFMRALEPCGVCAANVQECLMAQAIESGNRNVEAIVGGWLEELANGHYSKIAKGLGIKLSDVYAAEKVIGSFEPKPSRVFKTSANIEWMSPDIIIFEENGAAYAELVHSFLPHIAINPYYTQFLRLTDDEAVRDYLAKKVYSANKLIENVSNRENTILSCANAIAQVQSDFFLHGKDLNPLTVDELGKAIGVSKSTVSRAIRGKNIQCSRGVIPMSSFLTAKVDQGGEDSFSSDSIKRRIIELIRQEDKRVPISDQKITEILAKSGIKISRRAVAKYRDQFGIPATYARAEKYGAEPKQ